MKNYISRVVGCLISIKFYKPIQNQINKYFVKLFKIDLTDFEPLDTYPSIQRLFTRQLKKPRIFSLDTNTLISPTDSTIAQYGTLNKDLILQIKGLSYDLYSFLTATANIDQVKRIEDGSFINFYLSPRNYHRFHAPTDFEITKTIHVPGTLYPVKQKSLEAQENLFIKNERVILECHLKNNVCFYFVAIGAFNVGRITINKETNLRTNTFDRKNLSAYNYSVPIQIKKGEEIGFFEMGSSVVLLFEKNKIKFCDNIHVGQAVLFGDDFAKLF